MALDNPPRKEESHGAEGGRDTGERPATESHEHAPASPAPTPEQQARDQHDLAVTNEKLAGHAEKIKSKEGKEHPASKEHHEKGAAHGKDGHAGHGHGHAPKEGPVSKFFSAASTRARKVGEGTVKWYAILGGGTLFATEGAFTVGAALEGAGGYVASSLGWTQTGTAINAAGQALTGVGKVLLFNAMPVVLAAGIAVASIFVGGFVVDRVADWLLGAKPAKSAAKASGGDHGGGHGH